jgi:hypothetical protein
VDFEIVSVVKVLEEDSEVVLFLDGLVDLLACDDVDFVVVAFELLVTAFLAVDVEDFEDEVFAENTEVFVALLAEEVVEVAGGHTRGGFESYPVRILFTAE